MSINAREEWSLHPVVALYEKTETYCAALAHNFKTVEPVLFQLNWYGGAYELDGHHNYPVPDSTKNGRSFLSPAYLCTKCNRMLLVPFPQVEKVSELHYWLREHLENHS